MKQSKPLFKVFAAILFVVAIASGCEINDDDTSTQYTAAKELEQISNWLTTMKNNKMDIDTTSTGLFYIVDTKGTGETVKEGNTVTVKYVGYFLDGTVFDYSEGYTYVHKGTGSRPIQGWEEAIDVMKKGEKAIFLIPSSKAYGSTGYSSIPPYTPLLFVIQVVEIQTN